MRTVVVTRLEVIREGRPILSVAQLVLREGERVCLFGPNGAGKSTLLRSLALIERDHQQAVSYSPGTTPHEIGYMMQEPYFFRGTVRDNLLLPLTLRGYAKREREARLRRLAARYEIASLLSLSPVHLSGGEKQKVNLLRTLIYEPSFLYLDEPFNGLDALVRRVLTGYLHEYLAEDSTRCLVYTSHDIHEMLPWGERFIYLREGRVIFDHPRRRFLSLCHEQPPQDPYLAAFLNPWVEGRKVDERRDTHVDRGKRGGCLW